MGSERFEDGVLHDFGERRVDVQHLASNVGFKRGLHALAGGARASTALSGAAPPRERDSAEDDAKRRPTIFVGRTCSPSFRALLEPRERASSTRAGARPSWLT